MSLVVIQVILLSVLIIAVLIGSFVGKTEDDKVEAGKIVNGEEVSSGHLPYQASVQLHFGSRLVSSKATHFCGGAFLAPDWVVTAAHCVRNQREPQLKIVGGTQDITDQTSPAYKVNKIIMNKYNDITKHNDIALINIEIPPDNKARKSPSPILPVSICKESFDPSGQQCTVSGWGHLKSKGSSVPDKLRSVLVPVLATSVCGKMLSGYPWDTRTSTMLCAGGEDKDACQGDSGGPLVCQDSQDAPCLAGVVSWGVGCATEGIPGVYTNVSKYTTWISNHMAGKGWLKFYFWHFEPPPPLGFTFGEEPTGYVLGNRKFTTDR